MEIETFARHPKPAGVLAAEHDAQDLQAQIDEKIQEARFYISQQLWDLAKKSVNDLAELAPDAPEINELMVCGERRTIQAHGEFAQPQKLLPPPPLSRLRLIFCRRRSLRPFRRYQCRNPIRSRT